MYDPRTNRWQPIADMSVGRASATSGVICGRLVVVGGYDGTDDQGISSFDVSSGEMYDPRTNRWQPIKDMSFRRAFATGGVVCGRLIVVGGDLFNKYFVDLPSYARSGEMYY